MAPLAGGALADKEGSGGVAKALAPVVETSAYLDVWPAERQHTISKDFYSLFLETEINFGGEGGLLADQVWNGDFEALGRGDWWSPDQDEELWKLRGRPLEEGGATDV